MKILKINQINVKKKKIVVLFVVTFNSQNNVTKKLIFNVFFYRYKDSSTSVLCEFTFPINCSKFCFDNSPKLSVNKSETCDTIFEAT